MRVLELLNTGRYSSIRAFMIVILHLLFVRYEIKMINR